MAIQFSPVESHTWHREHLLWPFTGTRFGLPFVLPISDGTGPLGVLLFIVRLCRMYTPDKHLEEIIKVI